jgi:hypothetical protein
MLPDLPWTWKSPRIDQWLVGCVAYFEVVVLGIVGVHCRFRYYPTASIGTHIRCNTVADDSVFQIARDLKDILDIHTHSVANSSSIRDTFDWWQILGHFPEKSTVVSGQCL